MQCDGSPMLRLTNVSFSYKSEETLKDITFDIMPGEFVALMGPNGSGKTTTMRCINKMMKIDSGSIEIDGCDISDLTMSEISRLCTTVPADTSVDFSLTVRDYVALGRSPYIKNIWWEDENDERMIDDAMWNLAVAHYTNRRLHELSSGERARVLLAKGIVQTPKVLLVDEPSAHLDVKYKIQIMEILKGLSRKGLTILIASHDINLLTRFCDRILLLSKGRIVDYGLAKDVVTEEAIEKVFDIKVKVVEEEGTVYVLPTGSTEYGESSENNRFDIHRKSMSNGV